MVCARRNVGERDNRTALGWLIVGDRASEAGVAQDEADFTRIIAASRGHGRGRRQQTLAACAVAAVIIVAALVLVPPALRNNPTRPASPTAVACTSGWQVAPQPFAAGDRQHRLFAIGAASSSNAWAVGERWVNSPYRSGPRQVPYPLIEHWNGRAWTIAPVGNPNGLPGALYSITVLSAADAWAVGGFQADSPTTRIGPLVEHWNGVNWSLTPVPALANVGPHHEQTLVGVAGVSADDVWALGHASHGVTYVNALLRWNGQVWTRVVAPEPSSTSGLGSISLLTALAIDPATGFPWAIGGHLQGVEENFTFDGALFGTWTGNKWTDQPAPTGSVPLDAISTAEHSVFAIGRHALAASPNGERWGGRGRSSVLRWNGTHWHTVLSTVATLTGVSAVSNQNVWIAGTQHGPLLMHWNGSTWTVVANSAPVALPGGLTAITVANDKTVLALGVSTAEPGTQSALWTQCATAGGK
jgi:hypothetical protein